MPVKGKLMHSWVKSYCTSQPGGRRSHVACVSHTGDTYHVRLGTSAHFRVGRSEVSVATGSSLRSGDRVSDLSQSGLVWRGRRRGSPCEGGGVRMADGGSSAPGRGGNMGVVFVLGHTVLVVHRQRHHVRRVVLYSVSGGCRDEAAEGRA